MKVHDVKQGSMEWLMLRAGIVTASEMDSLITPNFEIKTGKGPKSYIAAKVAEKWQGGPLPSFQSFEMEQGAILEDEVVKIYNFDFNTIIERVGFVTTDDGRVGCSPDGMIERKVGLEIKCPAAHTHTRYLLDGVLPEGYAHQVHAGMYVTGLSSWKFISHRRGFPSLVVDVPRDESKQAVIREALELYHAEFEKEWKKMLEKNGGPPPSAQPLSPITPREERRKVTTEPLTYLA